MAWEARERGGSYYTRSYREDGRVRREYVGTGGIAETLAHADETRRRARELERKREREDLERLEALAAPVREVDDKAEVLARAVLVAAGYRRRKGEWRLRRGR